MKMRTNDVRVGMEVIMINRNATFPNNKYEGFVVAEYPSFFLLKCRPMLIAANPDYKCEKNFFTKPGYVPYTVRKGDLDYENCPVNLYLK